MFEIFDGREHFYQWDLDRKIIVSDASISQVHFCNKTDDESLVVEVYELDGKRVADVPNILLQNVWRICVYAWDSNYTKHMARFDVVERSKPATYVYTETEILNYETLLEKIEKMDSDIAGVVDEYLKENPPEIEVDLSDYYTKAQTDKVVSDAVAAIDIPTVPDVSEFITMEDVENKGYLTEHQQLKTINGESIVGTGNIVIEGGGTDGVEAINEVYIGDDEPTDENVELWIVPSAESADFALKSDIPDVSGFALKTDIPTVPDVSGFTTMSEVEAKGYQTEAEVNALIDAALGVIENGTY